MSKKKVPLFEGESKNGKQVCFEGFEPVHRNFTTGGGNGQEGRIAKLLRKLGAVDFENRATTKELCTVAGIKTPRQLQEQIKDEREFSPICSDGKGGYWLPDPASVTGRAEIHRTASTVFARGVETIGTARKLLRHIHEV